ncbi:MAG: LysM peptidoglycan-binding domain-containing protein [Chloroflexi bacterium]|nr:MAG: LysM peptidoglycan-binding domain-containing protein [Chloroflexota bacterium]
MSPICSLCWLLGTSVRKIHSFLRTDVPSSQHRPRTYLLIPAHPDAKPATNSTVQKYTVQEGDDLYSIAQQFYGDVKLAGMIYQANKKVLGGDPDTLTPGIELTLPSR